MGLFSKNTKSKPEKPIFKSYLNPVEELLSFKPIDSVEIALFEDHFNMRAFMSSNKTVYSVDYAQVTDVICGTEEEIIEKGKSFIGRAVAGGILFGGVGAVVGAVSGIGDKKVKKSKTIIVIAYTSSDGKEKFLQFCDPNNMIGKQFADKLTKLCNLKNNEQEQPKSGHIAL